MATQTHLLRYYVILVLAACFGGGNVVAGKLAVGEIDPSTLVVLRWIGAVIAILPLAIGPLRKDWPVVMRYWWLYLLFGSIGFFGFTIVVYIASYLTSGVNIALEQVMINVFVMLINFALFHIRVRWLQLLGVGLTVIGVALVATRGDLSRILELDINAGDAMMLIACLTNGLYIALLRFRPKTDLISFLCACFVAALLASLIYAQFAIGLDVLVARASTLSLKAWLIVAYAAIFPSLVTQLFYARGIEAIGANRASLFANLTPLSGALLSLLILSEPPQLFHLAAALLIVAGVAVAEWAVRRKPTTPMASVAERSPAETG